MRAFGRLLAFVSAVGLLVYGLASRRDPVWLATVWAAALPIGYLLFSLVPRQTVGWRRSAWKISAVVVVGFILLSLQLLRQQFVEASTIASTTVQTEGGPYSNPRRFSGELRLQRGRIFDRTGEVELAGREIAPNGTVRRTYPEPSSSYLIGYYSLGQYERVGLEQSYDDYLTGRRGNPVSAARRQLLRQPTVGNDLRLTLDIELQRLGQRLLGARRGAVIAMNPKTGEVLAMVSNPAYDAADLVYDPEQSDAQNRRRITAAYERIIANPGEARLTNRATQGLYNPGSTFKTVTAAAGLDLDVTRPDEVFEDDGLLVVNGFPIRDPNRPDESRTRWTFREGYMYSLNAVFAQVGLKVGSAGMREYAGRFLYERPIPFDLPVSESQVSDDPAFLSDRVALASTAFGQGQLLATPMAVLLSTATIANGGVTPRPYLVAQVRSPQGAVLLEPEHDPIGRVVEPQVAEAMKRIMVDTVEAGTGTNARIAGVQVGGKTGTAQLGATQDPHAWFTAFAPMNNPQVAVVVLVENGGEGAQVAAPLARQVIELALRNRTGR